jgi:RND family efflux transporter MFP subunit
LLRYYRISAPTSGVVGDIPVKVGDHVTPETRITTVDQDNLIEAYIYVPVSKVNEIKQDTSIVLRGADAGVLCDEKPTFISQQVNVESQTVLVKTVCPNTGELRSAQVLMARLVWATHPAITVPTTAVIRQAGQHFVFVVERGPHGAVARQRAILVGPIRGNDYVVTSGLAPGVEIVLSSIQRIHDGTPVDPRGAGAPDASRAEK